METNKYQASQDEIDQFFAKNEEEKKKADEAKSNFKNKFVAYDSKNYLDVVLPNGVTEKTITFRPLPFDPENGVMLPFLKIYSHCIKTKDGKYKYITCLEHTEGIDHLGLGKECPFCKINRNISEELPTIKDENEKKRLKDTKFQNRLIEQWLMRGIDRDHEEDGPKIWRFNSDSKGKGNYDKLNNLYKERKEESLEDEGKDYNIFDVYNGKDLKINFKKSVDGSGKVQTGVSQISDKSKQTPVTTNEELLVKWINDNRKWYLLFPPKPYAYLRILAQKGVPIWNKDYNMFTDKDEYDDIVKKGGTPVFDPNENNGYGEWKNADEIYGYPSSGETEYQNTSVKDGADAADDLPF